MKSTILLTIIFFCMHGVLRAQPRFGIQVGANYNRPASGTPPTLRNSFTSPYVGIVAKTSAGRVQFRLSTNYLQESYHVLKTLLAQPNADTAVAQLNIHSVELPLDCIYRITRNRVSFFVFAAPALTVGLKGTADSATGNGTQRNAIQFGNDDAAVKRNAYSGRFGFGFNFGDRIELNALYKVTLNDLSNNETSVKNKTITVSATWFVLGGKARKKKPDHT